MQHLSKNRNYRAAETYDNICPWHSWIARQTPTLKVSGSNPLGQAKIEKPVIQIIGFFILALCFCVSVREEDLQKTVGCAKIRASRRLSLKEFNLPDDCAYNCEAF